MSMAPGTGAGGRWWLRTRSPRLRIHPAVRYSLQVSFNITSPLAYLPVVLGESRSALTRQSASSTLVLSVCPVLSNSSRIFHVSATRGTEQGDGPRRRCARPWHDALSVQQRSPVQHGQVV